MFGLTVRFTCKDAASAEAFDELMAETVRHIQRHEPGTLIYAVHAVRDKPLQRIFYELYRDRAAFEEHGSQPHIQRMMADREQYLASVDVDVLSVRFGKGTDG